MSKLKTLQLDSNLIKSTLEKLRTENINPGSAADGVRYVLRRYVEKKDKQEIVQDVSGKPT